MQNTVFKLSIDDSSHKTKFYFLGFNDFLGISRVEYLKNEIFQIFETFSKNYQGLILEWSDAEFILFSMNHQNWNFCTKIPFFQIDFSNWNWRLIKLKDANGMFENLLNKAVNWKKKMKIY